MIWSLILLGWLNWNFGGLWSISSGKSMFCFLWGLIKLFWGFVFFFLGIDFVRSFKNYNCFVWKVIIDYKNLCSSFCYFMYNNFDVLY